MKLKASWICWGLLIGLASNNVALADPPKLDIPAEVKPSGQYAQFVPVTDAKSIIYVGLSGVDAVPSTLLRDPRTFLLDTRGMTAGKYRFSAVGSSKDGDQARVDFVVVIGNVPPGPDPKPPGPDPGPSPDTPPIPVEGFHVMFVHETADKLDSAQQAVLGSLTVRNYLNSKCKLEADGKNKSWRQYDQNDDVSGDYKVWQDAFARKRTSIPWIVVSNGKTGYEGPMPKTVAETMTLLRKYGGD